MMQYLASGMDMSERGQAMDATREVGPGNHFLGCTHTQANFESVFYQSFLADYSSYEQWVEEGRLTTEQRAHTEWKKMLSEYVDPGLEQARDEALRAFVTRRREQLTDDILDE
jgi:trimethylamine--corrinoid protein Co-methyltransferase